MTYRLERPSFPLYALAYGLPFVLAFLNFSLTVLFLDHELKINDPAGYEIKLVKF